MYTVNPIHRLAICREFIRVEHPPMSANMLIVTGDMIGSILGEAYWSNTSQLRMLYWSTVGPVSVAS